MAGRASKYDTHIVPNFDLIKEGLANGYEEKKIYTQIGVSKNVWYDAKKEKKEFGELFKVKEEDIKRNKEELFNQNTTFIQDIIKNKDTSDETKLRYLTYYESTRLGVLQEDKKQYYAYKKEELEIKKQLNNLLEDKDNNALANISTEDLEKMIKEMRD